MKIWQFIKTHCFTLAAVLFIFCKNYDFSGDGWFSGSTIILLIVSLFYANYSLNEIKDQQQQTIDEQAEYISLQRRTIELLTEKPDDNEE